MALECRSSDTIKCLTFLQNTKYFCLRLSKSADWFDDLEPATVSRSSTPTRGLAMLTERILWRSTNYSLRCFYTSRRNRHGRQRTLQQCLPCSPTGMEPMSEGSECRAGLEQARGSGRERWEDRCLTHPRDVRRVRYGKMTVDFGFAPLKTLSSNGIQYLWKGYVSDRWGFRGEVRCRDGSHWGRFILLWFSVNEIL